MSEQKQTPLMKQYLDIKAKYPETVLFYRLGDFFETFGDDAVITAKACGITLTKRNSGAGADTPLAGFPHHQLDVYLPKMVKAGYRVAVCEQLEDPKQSKGIVKRGVVEVVTPGVAMYDKLLDAKTNNYLAAVYFRTEKSGFRSVGIALCDISTGEFKATEVPAHRVIETLSSFSPTEIIISKQQKQIAEDELSKLPFEVSYTKLEDWIFDFDFTYDILIKHFETQSLKGYGLDKFSNGISAAGAVLHYINETQGGNSGHIKSISAYNPTEYMALDHATRRNLQIAHSGVDASLQGSLIAVIDKSITPMGGRLLKKWLSLPLITLEAITRRHEGVSAFFEDDDKRLYTRKVLERCGDLERLISKISTNRANPRDLVSLKLSLGIIPDLIDVLSDLDATIISALRSSLNPLDDLTSLLAAALLDEPTARIGTGQVFKKGHNAELDDYLHAKNSAKDWMKDFQERQRERSGIPSLKVGFNSVFGYYIEVTKTHTNKIPEDYNRKQTLRNAERYITPELKEMEEKILNAESKILDLESELFADLLSQVSALASDIQLNAAAIAEIDVLQSYAHISREHNYSRPIMDDSEILDLEAARHPIVERILPRGDEFTSNNTHLDTNDQQIHIITGPNMSGKSVYLRQIALCVLMAQSGCFVPAKTARIGVVDRIFTRVGAQDNLLAGESTFLVEMQEAANILNNATGKSLILLDEVGRGTATFDGISIAWSIAEYIHDFIMARTLFATHYHELNDLAKRYERVHNFKVEVLEVGNTIIFSHKVVPGGSDHSFGIHVAQMAGLPYDVIERAKEIMQTLEEGSPSEEIASSRPAIGQVKSSKKRVPENQLAIFEFRDDAIRERLRSLKIDSMTPVQSFQVLAQLIEQSLEEK